MGFIREWTGRREAKAIERRKRADQLEDERRELKRRGFDERDGMFWTGVLSIIGQPRGRVSGFRFWYTDFKQVLALLDDLDGRGFSPVKVGKDRTGQYHFVEVFESLKTGSNDDTREAVKNWIDKRRAAGVDVTEFDPWTDKEIKRENTPE